MSTHTPTIAVDFDGCLCEYAFPGCGPANEDVLALLRLLHEEGWRIIIWSCRTNSDWVAKGATPGETHAKIADMVLWLQDEGVPYDSIAGLSHWAITSDRRVEWVFSRDSIKPVANVYLDDRALNPIGLPLCEVAALARALVAKHGDPLAYHRALGRKM